MPLLYHNLAEKQAVVFVQVQSVKAIEDSTAGIEITASCLLGKYTKP
jgi:hypothetical protein